VSHICPSCGYNLARDEVIDRDGFMLDPRGAAQFHGDDLGLTLAEALTLYTVAQAKGRPVSREAILTRVSDSEDPNVVSVFLLRARRKLVEHSAPNPVRSLHGRGLAWGLI